MALLQSEFDDGSGNFEININTNKVEITHQTSWKNGRHVHFDVEVGVVTDITTATQVSLLKIPVGYRPLTDELYGFCSLKKPDVDLLNYRMRATAYINGNVFQTITANLPTGSFLTFSFDYLI